VNLLTAKGSEAWSAGRSCSEQTILAHYADPRFPHCLDALRFVGEQFVSNAAEACLAPATLKATQDPHFKHCVFKNREPDSGTRNGRELALRRTVAACSDPERLAEAALDAEDSVLYSLQPAFDFTRALPEPDTRPAGNPAKTGSAEEDGGSSPSVTAAGRALGG
jgi:hypothetical protein